MWWSRRGIVSQQQSSRREGDPGIWTPANIVTCVRIVFIPVFMILLYLSYSGDSTAPSPVLAFAAFLLYVVLSLTDKVDGYLARSRHEITDFGKFLDPIADKLLVFSALLLLMDMGYVNLWFVFIILVREFLVSALRMVASAAGVVIAADKLGKAKTAVTMVALCGYLLTFALTALFAGSGVSGSVLMLNIVADALMIAAVVLTVVSGVQYLWNSRDIITS